MGQLWDRLKRFGESHINDFMRDDPDYAKMDTRIVEELRRRAGVGGAHSHRRETEEERLKRLIEEAANPQGSAQHNNRQNASQGQRNSSGAPRHDGMTLEEALSALGLPPNASVEDIKKQYKKLMLQYHPDRVGALDQAAQAQARDKAQRINRAYEVVKKLKGV
jgi:DnaJ-domain-containing protein 1